MTLAACESTCDAGGVCVCVPSPGASSLSSIDRFACPSVRLGCKVRAGKALGGKDLEEVVGKKESVSV